MQRKKWIYIAAVALCAVLAACIVVLCGRQKEVKNINGILDMYHRPACDSIPQE